MLQDKNIASERRYESRLIGPFPVFVRWKTHTGSIVKMHTLIDNVSQGGMYLQLPQTLSPGKIIFSFIELPSGAKFAARGQVLRTEVKSHGLLGLALFFKCTRMLSNYHSDLVH